MKITAIKQQVKDKNRASIYVEGKYSFSLDLDQLVSEKLKVGIVLGDNDLVKFKKKSADGKLRARAIEWVSIRPRATQEFKDYLKRKNCDSDLMENLIADMIQKNYLSDEKYARWLSELKSRQLKSTKEIRFLLKQKCVDSKIIDSVINEISLTEKLRLANVVEKKRKITKYREDKKLLEHLIRKGYSFSDVKEALAEG